MRRWFALVIGLMVLSCNNERIIQLPEVENSEITEVIDVSPAYIFYDETQPDSTLFNRKNLIGTTNWLVNVDKRLTLEQAIPHIQYLQNKRKKASMHKNENAKNYLTCNDTSIKNLGFIEFTDIEYINDIKSYENENPVNYKIRTIYIHFFNSNFFVVDEYQENQQIKNEGYEMKQYFNFEYFSSLRNEKNNLNLSFDKSMSIQKYLEIKHNLSNFTNEMSTINSEEFIY